MSRVHHSFSGLASSSRSSQHSRFHSKVSGLPGLSTVGGKQKPLLFLGRETSMDNLLVVDADKNGQVSKAAYDQYMLNKTELGYWPITFLAHGNYGK